MSVMGHWRRSALGAGGVALLLPLALAVGVGLTAALGGQTSLRALGQVFGGPAVPPELSAPELGDARAVPSVPPRRPARARPDGARPSGAAAGSGAPAPARAEPDAPGPQAPPAESQPTGSPGPEPQAAPAPTPGAEAPAAPQGSVVHQTGQAVTDVVAELPAPVGGPAGNAMQTVVDLIP